MRPIYQTFNPPVANLNSEPIIFDQYIAPGNVTVTISNYTASTTITGHLYYTTDNLLDPNAPNVIWQPYTASPFNGTTDPGAFSISGAGANEAAFQYAPKAMRITWGTITGSPYVQVQAIQAGIGGT